MRNPVADTLARDATALLRLCTPADFPGGIAVVNEHTGGRIIALSVGDGRGLAQLYRRRDAAHLVLVDVARVMGGATEPTAAHRARVDALALHEAAHSLFGQAIDEQEADNTLVGVAARVDRHTATRVATDHHPRWAAAFWLLAERAAVWRRYRDLLLADVRAALPQYGFDPAALERLCRGVPADASLAELLAADGPGGQLAELAAPDMDERAAAAVAAGMVVATPTGGGA